jgi:glucose 1-dehydrogenase
MESLQGKTALVTGAGAGIGRGCAIEFARRGARAVIADIDKKLLHEAMIEIDNVNGYRIPCRTILADVFDYTSTSLLLQSVEDLVGRIDMLVTGPASTVRKPAIELEPEDLLKTFSDDLVSHWYLAKLVARDMIRRKSGGHIIFISSVYGSLVRKGSLPYDAAKAALNQATRVLAKEWAPYGIRVNAIEPGFVHTPGEEKFATPEEIENTKSKLLLGAATSEDIGKVAVMLASTEHITGQIIRVDGGHGLVDLYDQI